MKTSRIDNLTLGAFVLAVSIGFLVTLIMMIGKTGATETYYTTYPQVRGIKSGTPVLIEGFHVGQVEAIEPEQKKGKVSFRIKMQISKDWRPNEDSIARLTTSGLLSAVSIDISNGKSEKLLEPGSTIKSAPNSDLFAVMQDVAETASDLSENAIKPLLESLQVALGGVSEPIREDVPAIIKNLRKTTEALAQQTPLILEDMQQASAKLNGQVLTDENVNHINAALQNIDLMSKNLSELSGGLHSAIKSVDDMVSSNKTTVDKGLRDLQYTLRNVANRIDGITNNLDTTARNMSEFSRVIRENPSLLIRGNSQTE